MKSLKTLLFAAIATIGFGVNSTYADTIKKCDVNFTATGSPGFVTIDGEATSPCEGKIEMGAYSLISERIELDLTKLETGISLRDRHMKNKYLEVKKHPKAVLTGLKTPDEKTFEGMLELHGVKKKISGEYKIEGDKVYANFKIRLSDYLIKIPSFMGVTVAETVSIRVNLSK